MAYDHRPSPKQPPQSVDAECAVLGGLMVWNAAWHPVSAIVTEADFYTADHREVFAAIAALCKAGRAADAVSVGSYLRDRHGRELASYAMTLAADTASAANIETHAQIVRDCSRRRDVIAFAAELAEAAHGSADGEQLAAQAATRLDALMRRSASQSVGFGEMVRDALAGFEVARRQREAGETVGATFGLDGIDWMTGGFHGPRLILLAARPKCGKTALLNQLALNSAAAVGSSANPLGNAGYKKYFVARDGAGRIVGLLSADYEFVNSSGDRFHQGQQFFRDEWASQFAKHPDFRIRVGKVIADEGGVALFGYSEGTYAPDGNLRPENKWSVPAAFLVMARDGKVTYFESFSDASMVYDLIQSRTEDGEMK